MANTAVRLVRVLCLDCKHPISGMSSRAVEQARLDHIDYQNWKAKQPKADA